MPIPADHSTTVGALGALGTIKMMSRVALGYHHTIAYLIKRRKFRNLYNFFYTKTLVPTGEGSGELAYYLIGNLLQKYPHLAPYPKYIELEVTTKCNKRCIICEHTYWNEKAVDLSFDEFKKLVDQFNLRWINLTGEGDAFLNKDYLKMIAYSKKKGISVYLVDSMDLVNKDISQELVRLGVDGLYISMDGATQTTYEKIKAGCNFWKVIDNLRMLLQWKEYYKSPLPEICFRYVVTKANVYEMAHFVRLLQSLGKQEAWGGGSKIHYVGLLDYPEIHDLYLDKIPQEHIDDTIRISRSNGTLPVVFAHLEDTRNPSINRCLAWMEPYFALVPEPMVLPCCAVLMSNDRKKLLEYSFGNYMKTPFREIWNSSYYKWFRGQVTKKDGKVPMLCAECRAYDTLDRIHKYGIDRRKANE